MVLRLQGTFSDIAEWKLQRAEMRMVRWMFGIKLKVRFPSKELRERLGIDDIALVLQQNKLWWHGHVLRKEDDDWVKKCMEYEVEGPRPRGRPKRTWREVVREDCQAHKLNTEDAMDRNKWRKLIKDVRVSGWVFLLVLAYPGCPGPKAIKRLCVLSENLGINVWCGENVVNYRGSCWLSV